MYVSIKHRIPKSKIHSITFFHIFQTVSSYSDTGDLGGHGLTLVSARKERAATPVNMRVGTSMISATRML